MYSLACCLGLVGSRLMLGLEPKPSARGIGLELVDMTTALLQWDATTYNVLGCQRCFSGPNYADLLNYAVLSPNWLCDNLDCLVLIITSLCVLGESMQPTYVISDYEHLRAVEHRPPSWNSHRTSSNLNGWLLHGPDGRRLLLCSFVHLLTCTLTRVCLFTCMFTFHCVETCTMGVFEVQSPPWTFNYSGMCT